MAVLPVWRRRIFQQDIWLLPQVPNVAEAIQCPVGAAYDEPGSAFTAHTHILMSGLNARVRNALAQIVWTPNNAACGVQIIRMDSEGVNVEQLAEITGNASAAPVHTLLGFTAALQAIVDDITSKGVPTGPNNKTLGYRTKGNGAVGPLLYGVKIMVLWEV